MAVTCIFCDQPANSREHAIPAWVSKRFGLRGEFLGEVRRINAPRRKQHISLASHRAWIFCEQCQRHFKALEDRVCDLLDDMGHTRPVTLGAQDRDALARWGAKTAFALIAAERDNDGNLRSEEIPREHRLAVRAGTTPDHVYVAYAVSGELGARMIVGTPSLDDDSRDDSIRTYNVVLSFGEVLMKVFSVFEPREPHRLASPTWNGNPLFMQVNPAIDGDIPWPLSVAVTAPDAFDFVPVLK